MSLLNGLTPPPRAYSCKVRTIASQLEEKDAKILINAVNNSELWPSRTLCNALQERGIQLSDLSITRHRKKLCSCAG